MIRALSIILLCCLAGLLFGQSDTYDSESFISRASNLSGEQQYTEAINLLNKVHPCDPNYLTAQFELVASTFNGGMEEEAYKIIQRHYAIGNFELHPPFYVLYHQMLRKNKRTNEAIDILQEGLAILPDYCLLSYHIGVALYSEDRKSESVKAFKRALTCDPQMEYAHAFLAEIAFESGEVALGSLAGLAYITLDPKGKFAQSMCSKLNQPMGNHYQEKLDIAFSEQGDNFSKLEKILRAEFPLNPKYPLKSDIDENITRHIQAIAKYCSSHEIKNGFFENAYVPFLKAIHDRGLSEQFGYYLLSGIESDHTKTIKNKQKEIDELYNDYLLGDMWGDFATRKRDVFGDTLDVVIFMENGYPSYMTPVVDGKQHGLTKYVDAYGRPTIKVVYKAGNAEGEAIYYDSLGMITHKSDYINDLQNGKEYYYFDNGQIAAEYNYSDGDLVDEFTTYYRSGQVKCHKTLKDGQLHGKSICYHENGSTSEITNYSNGKLAGIYESYLSNGTLTERKEFLNDKLNGTATFYNEDGSLAAELSYEDGNESSDYAVVNMQGDTVKLFKYEDDQKSGKLYYYEGKKLSQVSILKGDDVKQTDYYDHGELYFTEYYRKGKIIKQKQYGQTPEKTKDDGNIYYPSGQLYVNRNFENGQIHGLSTAYHRNGVKKSIIPYNMGKEDGLVIAFDEYGRKTVEYHSVNDTINGTYLNYSLGKIYSNYSYRNGSLHGPYFIFHPDSSIRSQGYFQDGNQIGYSVSFDFAGDTISVAYYRDAIWYKSDYPNRENGELTTFTIPDSGLQTFYYPNSVELRRYHGIAGVFDQANVRLNTAGDTISIDHWSCGKLHGKTRSFHPSGKLSFQGNKVMGNYQGKLEFYDDMGNKASEGMYMDDVTHGQYIRYHPSGTIFYVANYVADERHGDIFYLNMDGDTVLTLNYYHGHLEKYRTIENKNWKSVTNETTSIAANYPNGNPAVAVGLLHHNFDGAFVVYNTAGQTIYSRQLKNGILDGDSKKYYPNGQLYEFKQFYNGYDHGKHEYFDSDGNLLLKTTMHYDEPHGMYEVYDKGNILIQKEYKYGIQIK